MVEHQAWLNPEIIGWIPKGAGIFFSGETVRDLLILLPKISSKMAIQKQILPILVEITIFSHDMSHLIGKPTICICENKDADQLRGAVTAKLISAFVFATLIVQSI